MTIRVLRFPIFLLISLVSPLVLAQRQVASVGVPLGPSIQNTAVGSNSGAMREVLYDHKPPQKLRTARVQVLIDSSASMRGFRKSLPALLHAVDEGLSYSRDV